MAKLGVLSTTQAWEEVVPVYRIETSPASGSRAHYVLFRTMHPRSGSREPDNDVTEIIDQPDFSEVDQTKPERSRKVRRIVLISLMIVLVLASGGLLGSALYVRSVEGSIERADAFEDVPEEFRPVKEVPDAKNFLMLGSDGRDPNATSGSRTDAIIIAHLPAGRASVQLISIPRDTRVHVPKAETGRQGNVNAKINAAFAWGGIPLMVQTLEEYTGVRIDNVIVVDFAGFKEIVDALGGIDITVEKGFTSTHSLFPNSRWTFKAGPQVMDGGNRHGFGTQESSRRQSQILHQPHEGHRANRRGECRSAGCREG